jgi:hypothetical protein
MHSDTFTQKLPLFALALGLGFCAVVVVYARARLEVG